MTADSKVEPSKFTPQKGWSKELRWLLLQGLVSAAWGIALCVFALVHVPVAWNISQAGQKYPATTNAIVTLIATVSTTHITYILQRVIAEYSKSLVVDGFTLNDLQWMQCVNEVALLGKFPRREGGASWPKRRLLWIVIYAGLAFHSSSLVAILQPEIFFKHKYYNNPIPCGLDLGNLSLGGDSFLSDAQQQYIDSFSFNVGVQLANYGDQVNGNTTTAVAGRVYSKDSYAYGAIGGLQNGLQEIPGVLFLVQCSANASSALPLWQAAFPDRAPPTLTKLPDGSRNFTDAPLPAQIGLAISDVAPFNITQTHAAMYALVEPSGSGALVSVGLDFQSGSESTLVCSWQALPTLVQVQMVNFTAGALSASGTSTYPSLAGRATLKTLEGMAQAARTQGASLPGAAANPTRNPLIFYLSFYNSLAAPAQILATLLADGGKAGLTAYNMHEWQLDYVSNAGARPALCDPQNRTVQEHWRFGNSNNLGWVATVWTTGIGLLAVCVAWCMHRVPRMRNVSVLNVAEAFALGRGDVVRSDKVLYVERGSGKVIRADSFDFQEAIELLNTDK